MHLSIEVRPLHCVTRSTKVHADEVSHVMHLADFGTLVFEDSGGGPDAVFVRLSPRGWADLERIMRDRAFASECTDREMADEVL